MNGLPIVIGKVGMHQTDDTARRFHLDGQRQGIQACSDADLGVAIARVQPFAAMEAMIHVGNGVFHGAPPRHEVVIPADRVKPGALQPSQNLGGLWPAINEIADGEQAVMLGGKPGCGKRGSKPAEMAVNVANGEVAAFGV